MQEKGIFLPDGSFESDKQIRRKTVSPPIMETEKRFPRDFTYWSDRFIQRQKEYNETSDVETDYIKIRFKGDTVINFIGDAHVGASATHYDRLEKEIKAIDETPNSYIILVGDLVDGFFWNPAQMEQIEQMPEQYRYMKALIKHLTDSRKLLLANGGDHDGWAKKMGIDPYETMNNLGAYYVQGVSHLCTFVDDQEYKIIGAHRLPGSSIRDNTWAGKRASHEIQGADIYYNAHTHIKGHSEQSINEFGGIARKVHYISLGPYKPTDEYSRKLGFVQQDSNSMYGCSILLKAKSKEIIYYDDILKANS